MVWLSDTHYGGDIWMALCRHVDYIDPELVIGTGDFISYARNDQFDLFVDGLPYLNAPFYGVPGNHDSDQTLTGMLNKWDMYDQYAEYGLLRHFAVDIGNFRIIGFSSYETDDALVASEAYIDASEVVWVVDQLQNLDGQTPILATHYNVDFLIRGGSWPTLEADLATYGVKGFLTGHDHFDCTTVVYGDCINILGASSWGKWAGQTPGMMLWYVFEDRMELDYHRAVYPFDSFGLETTPAYTPITISM